MQNNNYLHKSNPLISIIIPVFNNEKYLPGAVSSVTDQSFDDYEIIIIDDGSTDRTPVIADEIAADDRRIRVVHQENRWIYGAMNRGITEANGEYVYILNSDDILYPNALGRMAHIVQTYDVDVIWTRIDEYDHFGDRVQFARTDEVYESDVFFATQEEVRLAWPKLYFQHIAVNQANLYRRELMSRHPFREDVYGADVLFNISIADEVDSAYLLKESVYRFYDYHSSSNNASVGKFYPYEHDMFNDFYLGYLKLFDGWEIPTQIYREQLADLRIRQVSHEVRSYGHSNCQLSDREKVERILANTADETVMHCAEEYDREWEVESRILSGINDVFSGKTICDEEIKILVDGLVCLRFSEDRLLDVDRWNSYINHPLNTMRVGKLFLNHFIEETG